MDANDNENNEYDSSVFVRSVNNSEPLQLEDNDATQLKSEVRFPSCRFVLAIMGFLGFVNVYCLRVNLSVALVAMLNHTQHYDNVSRNHSENNNGDICESTGRTEFGKEGMKSGEFNWNSHTQGTVLAAFFYGYITTQV